MSSFHIDRFDLVRMRWTLAALRFELAVVRYALALKAGFNPDQPRVPAGNPDGGQWRSGGGASATTAQQGTSDSRAGEPASAGPHRTRPRITIYASERYEDSGSAANAPAGAPPAIPAQEPGTAELRNLVIKEAAKWLLKASIREAAGPIGTFLNVLDAAVWTYRFYPYVQSYLDPPKTLGELQRSVFTPQRGYDIHHIVEQTPAEQDGFSRRLIDGPENLVRIPTLKHWEITAWYATSDPTLGGISPRAYLRGKPWSERTRVGIYALKRFGVLKP